MTYANGGLIEAADYNTFATAASNVGNIYCIGSTNQGYGQLSNGFTTIQTVTATGASAGYVTADQWNLLIEAINVSGKHQSGASFSNVSNVQSSTALNDGSAADGVVYSSVLQNGSRVPITTLTTQLNANRLNADTQGATSTVTSTNSTGWSDFLTFTTTITFSTANQARYFFNSGGQIGVSLVHGNTDPGTINTLIADLCSELGTIWLSSGTCTLAGVNYTGLTQIGGTSTRTTYPNGTGLGFYALTSSTQQGVKQNSDVYYKSYGSTSFLSVSYRYVAPTLTIITTIDEVGTSGPGYTVGTPTVFTATVRVPETTFLANTWGAVTPVITQSRA